VIEIAPGMKVKCIWSGGWRKSGVGPAFGEALIVQCVLRAGETTSQYRVRQAYLGFAQWEVWYPARHFRPFDWIDELQERIAGAPVEAEAEAEA
jgi:hypothetical protein